MITSPAPEEQSMMKLAHQAEPGSNVVVQPDLNAARGGITRLAAGPTGPATTVTLAQSVGVLSILKRIAPPGPAGYNVILMQEKTEKLVQL
jgi:hypothetical protein